MGIFHIFRRIAQLFGRPDVSTGTQANGEFGSGRRGREFESRQPDHFRKVGRPVTVRGAVFAGFCAIACAASARPVLESVDGQESFALESDAVSDLSGIVWTGGDSFVAVSDKKKALIPLTLKIDAATGRIASGEIGEPVPVPADAADFEGVAYVAAAKTFYISAESGGAVLRFRPGQPRAERLVVPAIFAQARKNLSLESMTWSDTAKQFWIANEEALIPDGPLASEDTGSLVRLQRFDAKFRPTAQYAWRTEPAAFRFHGAGSGVSDLCLLPDGSLIVLERGFGAGGLHLRLYLADFQNATDTSRLPALVDAPACLPARKILLLDRATGFVNFEGLTLGPTLADGTRSLIVIADSNGGPTHTFLPLKIRLEPAAHISAKPAKGSSGGPR